MNKILIVGIVASGKSTFSKKLALFLDINCYELDQIVHKEINGVRKKLNSFDQMEIINKIDDLGEWIFEGVHRESYKELYNKADLIIFLDMPLYLRVFRIFLRIIKQNLKIEKCHYKPNFQMLKWMIKWTKDFEKDRAEYNLFLNNYLEKLVIINNKRELNKYLKEQKNRKVGKLIEKNSSNN